jgi:hypothetical protein
MPGLPIAANPAIMADLTVTPNPPVMADRTIKPNTAVMADLIGHPVSLSGAKGLEPPLKPIRMPLRKFLIIKRFPVSFNVFL